MDATDPHTTVDHQVMVATGLAARHPFEVRLGAGIYLGEVHSGCGQEEAIPETNDLEPARYVGHLYNLWPKPTLEAGSTKKIELRHAPGWQLIDPGRATGNMVGAIIAGVSAIPPNA
ncbi:MAG: hypothetical protein KUL86_09045 [Castellaniella sp.]|nr:hypothetical protein [Castellaniella sp.]